MIEQRIASDDEATPRPGAIDPSDPGSRRRLGAFHRWRPRIVGAALAALIGSVPGILGLVEPSWEVLVVMSAFGVPIAGILGWRLGPSARRGTRTDAMATAAEMAIVAVVAGDLAVCTVSALSTWTGESNILGADLSNLVGAIGMLLLLAIVGLLVVGMPALSITLTAAIAWVAIMRLLPAGIVGCDRSPAPPSATAPSHPAWSPLA